MRSKSRGIALILNNFFPNEEGKMRKGSHFDSSYLEQFLRFCNFDVDIKNDVNSKVSHIFIRYFIFNIFVMYYNYNGVSFVHTGT